MRVSHKEKLNCWWPTLQAFSCPGCGGKVYFGADRYICDACGLPISLWLAGKLMKKWRIKNDNPIKR